MTERYPISICMAGAVSAGAYSAGAMSVLLESIRLLEDQNLDLPDAPTHRIILKGMSGASAGSIQAALSTLDIFSSDPNQELGRKAWLQTSLLELLEMDDLESRDEVTSLLNSDFLRANAVARTQEHSAASTKPAFVSDNFRVRLSITNLRGVPYKLNFPSDNTIDFGMSEHSEYLAYQFGDYASDTISKQHYIINPYSITSENFDQIVDGALASSAFPAAFTAGELTRPNHNDDNAYSNLKQAKLTKASNNTSDPTQVSAQFALVETNPAWNEPDINKVYAIDGGTTNNEPLIEAFKVLYGDDFTEWETIDENQAGRVIFIDPFPNPVDRKIDAGSLRLDKNLGAMISAIVSQARLSKKLIVSKIHQDHVGLVYPSLPWRKTVTIGDIEVEQLAIKSGGMGGFTGFLKKEFLEHDYQLGRLNMKRFLRYHFTLDVSDSAFQGDSNYTDQWKTNGRAPIIPVYEQQDDGSFIPFNMDNSEDGKTHYYREGLKDYPHKFTSQDRDAIKGKLKPRLRVLGARLVDNHGKNESGRYRYKDVGWFEVFKNSSVTKSIFRGGMKVGWYLVGAGFLTDAIIRTFEDQLAAQGLLDYPLYESGEPNIPEGGDEFGE